MHSVQIALLGVQIALLELQEYKLHSVQIVLLEIITFVNSTIVIIYLL